MSGEASNELSRAIANLKQSVAGASSDWRDRVYQLFVKEHAEPLTEETQTTLKALLELEQAIDEAQRYVP